MHFDPPSLFVRADLNGASRPAFDPQPAPAEPVSPARESVLDAFLGYAEACLGEGANVPAGPRFATPASIARRHLADRGFDPADLRAERFGLYTTPQDVHDHLHRMGFSERTIRESGLVFDADGRPRHDWTGNVVVPLPEHGDVYVFDPQDPRDASFLIGPHVGDVAAFGLRAARAAVPRHGRLLLVEDVVDAIYLRRNGLPETAATGCPPAEFTPERWRALVREGIESVTLAFQRDTTRERRIRDALSHALVARTAPEVFVLEPRVLRPNDSAAEYVRRYGAERFRNAVRTAVHAFGGKDYGRDNYVPKRERIETRDVVPSRPAPRRVPSDVRTRDEVVARFRSFLVGEIEKIARPAERSAWHAFLVDVESALHRGEFERARSLVDNWYARLQSNTGSNTAASNITAAPATRGTTTLGQVVDGLRRTSGRELVDFDFPRRNERPTPAFETVAVATPGGRLGTIAERLAEAIAEHPEGRHVVVCHEFSPRTIGLALVQRMANDLTDGPGLDAEQVWDRLAGRDDDRGYEDRPWLVDEAIDRLRRSFVGVEFVTPSTADEWTLDRFRGDEAITSILVAAGSPATGDAIAPRWRRLLDAVHGFDAPVTVVIDVVEEILPIEYRYEPEWSNWWPTSGPAPEETTHRGFHDVLREWIAYVETGDRSGRFTF